MSARARSDRVVTALSGRAASLARSTATVASRFVSRRPASIDAPRRAASACSSATTPAAMAARAGMSKRLNPIPMRGEVVGAEPAEQPASCDGAHLVIELRPAHASAAVAETDEVGRVRVGDSRGGGVVGPSMASPPFMPGARTRGRDRDARSAVSGTTAACPGRRSDGARGPGGRTGVELSRSLPPCASAAGVGTS